MKPMPISDGSWNRRLRAVSSAAKWFGCKRRKCVGKKTGCLLPPLYARLGSSTADTAGNRQWQLIAIVCSKAVRQLSANFGRC